MTDPLSPLARDILNANPAAYGKLTVADGTPPATWALLGKVTPNQLLAVSVVNAPAAYAVLAGLWLWHDGLHECHEIAQKSPTDLLRLAPPARQTPPSHTGQNVQPAEARRRGGDPRPMEDMTASLSFWHAIMHRREGDFWNSKYWYARCRHHPALAEIPVHAESAIQQLPGLREVEPLTRSGWDADGFVDLVGSVHRDPADPRHAAAVRLQQIEWQVLFDYCLGVATGRG